MKRIIAIGSDHDWQTRITRRWLETIIAQIPQEMRELFILSSDLDCCDIRKQFAEFLSPQEEKLLVYYGHGNTNGEFAAQLNRTSEKCELMVFLGIPDAGSLCNCHVYTIACHSGTEMASMAAANGCISFTGLRGGFALFAEKFPENDKLNDMIGIAVNSCLEALLKKGLTWQESINVLKDTYEYYLSEILKDGLLEPHYVDPVRWVFYLNQKLRITGNVDARFRYGRHEVKEVDL